MNEGEKLRLLIKKDSRDAKKIASLINVNQNTLLNLYKRTVVSNDYKYRFKEIGIDIDANALINPVKETVVNEPEINHTAQHEGRRLQKLIKSGDVKAKELCEMLDMSEQYLQELYAKEKLPPKWKGLMKEAGYDIDKEEAKNMNAKNLIPLYNAKAMAGLQNVINNEAEYIEGYYSVPVPKATHLMRIAGNSMYPKYCNGDVVAVQLLNNHNYIHLGSAHIIVLDEQVFIKFLRKGNTADEWMLEPLNLENFDSFPVKKGDVLKLYIVRGTVRLDEL